MAHILAENQYNLILTARSEDKLQTMAHDLSEKHHAHALPADLSEPNATEHIMNQIEAQGLQVDVLINNAGIGDYAPFQDKDYDKIMRMLQVNIVALTQLTKRLVDRFLRQGHGQIMNISSVAGFRPSPWMSVYAATKAYVTTFTAALAEEMKGTAIDVSAFHPGATKTNFEKVAHMEHTNTFDNALSAREVAEEAFMTLEEGLPYGVASQHKEAHEEILKQQQATAEKVHKKRLEQVN